MRNAFSGSFSTKCGRPIRAHCAWKTERRCAMRVGSTEFGSMLSRPLRSIGSACTDQMSVCGTASIQIRRASFKYATSRCCESSSPSSVVPERPQPTMNVGAKSGGTSTVASTRIGGPMSPDSANGSVGTVLNSFVLFGSGRRCVGRRSVDGGEPSSIFLDVAVLDVRMTEKCAIAILYLWYLFISPWQWRFFTYTALRRRSSRRTHRRGTWPNPPSSCVSCACLRSDRIDNLSLRTTYMYLPRFCAFLFPTTQPATNQDSPTRRSSRISGSWTLIGATLRSRGRTNTQWIAKRASSRKLRWSRL